MDRVRDGRTRWVIVLVVLITAAAAWMLRKDDAGLSNPHSDAVIPSQQGAIDAILAALPVKFTTDDDGRVTKLIARGPDMTDAVAAHLQELPDLTDLQLEGSAIGSDGLQVIGGLHKLQSLRLAGTKITAGDLHHLADLKSLQQLFLSDCPVGDEGLEALQELDGLQLLDLDKTQVTDEGVRLLGGLASLEKLYLTGTQVTGAGFGEFPDTSALALLKLNDTRLTAEGLDALRRFANMQMLYLEGVKLDDVLLVQLMDVVTGSFPRLSGLFLARNKPLTDASVEPLMALAEMPDLGLVDLSGTQITKPAFKRLATETPEIRYQVNYSEEDE